MAERGGGLRLAPHSWRKEGTTMWMMVAAAGLAGVCSAVLLTLSVYYR
jgi:hypothetical protein